MQAFQSAGEWWTPGSSESRVVGMLEFRPDRGFDLAIPLGSLSDSDREPIVHGRLYDGRIATLVNPIRTHSGFNSSGSTRADFLAARGFIGESEIETDPLVDKIAVEYAHLSDWVARPPATFSPSGGAASRPFTVTVHYEAPPEIPLYSGTGCRIALRHLANTSTPSVRGVTFMYRCVATINIDPPLRLRNVETSYTQPLGEFLSFCLDSHTYQYETTVHSRGIPKPWNLCSAQFTTDYPNKVIWPLDMLLPLDGIRDRTSSLLENWFTMNSDEHRAVSLLIGVNGRQHAPSDLRFLAAAQALEALARTGANEEEMEAAKFERYLDVVKRSIVDEKVQRWATRKLKFANRRSSAELVWDLAARVGDYVNCLAPDRHGFLDDIRTNRNFYTHRDSRGGGRIRAGGELYVLTQGVVCLLKAAILRRLDFSPPEVQGFMKRCSACAHWSREVAEQYSR